MNFFLIGFMGSGKTTLGKQLATALDFTFIDSDQYIEKLEKRSIPEIFKAYGEPYFREKEKDFLCHAKLLDKCVISTGAGLPCFEDTITQLNNLGTTIWLNPDEHILIERLKKESGSRPKLAGYNSVEEAVHNLLHDRKKFYEQAKWHVKNPTPENLLQLIKTNEFK